MKPFIAAASLILLNTLAWADIAPTQFYGGCIIPVGGSTVTMESANVEIRWGTPCTLRAVFVMQNPSASAQEVLVGFPMPSLDGQRDETPDPLGISFNGSSAEMTASGMNSRDARKSKYWDWYSCEHSFVPGKTVVEVNTVLRASLLKAVPYQECLRYCIESGGKWAGSIGVEDVAIIFPSEVEGDQITMAKPAGAKIEDNRVSWSLKNFKPKGDEFDVTLSYVRPDAMNKITQLRNEFKQQPQSAAAAIKLAKHLFALGYPFMREGEALLRDVLKKDPHNAEAWNVYLAFVFVAYGQRSRMTALSEKQTAFIKDAVKNCPNDECIGLWGKAIERAPKPSDHPDELLEKTIEEKGYLATEFPNVNYNYY